MPADGNHPKRFDVVVNHKSFQTHDPLVKGRDILELAGLRPADEHMLLQRDDDGTLEEINLAKEVDLRKPPIETFYAFRGDRLYYWVLDERRYPWGAATISVADLREIAQVPADRQVWLVRKHEPDLQLGPNDTVQLDGKGVEHLYTVEAPVYVTIEFNFEPREILAGEYTTEQLKSLLGVEDSWELDIIDEHDGLRPLEPGEIVNVVCGLKLVSHVRQGGSS